MDISWFYIFSGFVVWLNGLIMGFLLGFLGALIILIYKKGSSNLSLDKTGSVLTSFFPDIYDTIHSTVDKLEEYYSQHSKEIDCSIEKINGLVELFTPKKTKSSGK